MSQIEPTDLLCKSRREELSVDEQRRLNESLERSLEVKLMSEMLSELEQDSRMQPGDDALFARITARALAKPKPERSLSNPAKAPSKRHALRMLLAAAAVLLVASLASALRERARQAQGQGDSEKSFFGWPWKAAKPARPRPVLPITKPLPSQTVQNQPDAGDAAGGAGGASGAGGAPDIPTVKPTAPAPKAVLSSSASELFARANLNRRQGHGAEAASLYQLLLERYPSSREDGPARLALAKYYQAKQPEQALTQFRAVAGSGGALRAEALWGISEVATSLGQRSLAEQALADLIREFPDSPYAEVARTRTTHGLP